MTLRYVPDMDSYVFTAEGKRPVRLPGCPLFYASKKLALAALAFGGK